MHINELGKLVDLAKVGFSQPLGYGIKSYNETVKLLEAVATSVDGNGDIDIGGILEKIGQPRLIPNSDGGIKEIVYPGMNYPVQFVFPELNCLSDKARNIDLASLLSKRSLNVYKKFEVITLGGLIDLVARGFEQPRNFGKKCYVETLTLLHAAAKLVDHNGLIDIALLFNKIGKISLSNAISDHKTTEKYVSAQFPILRFTSEQLERLSDKDKSQPLHNLHLDERAASAMDNFGILDVGGFVELIKRGINANDIENYDEKASNSIASSIVALSYSIKENGGCDWLGYASMLGFKILPSENIVTARDVLNLFQECVRKAVEAQFENNKKYNLFIDIYNEKINTTIGEEKTLEQIGSRHSRSRERVRQLESKIIKCLSESLLNGCYSIPVLGNNGKTYEALRFRFRPAFEAVIKSAKTAFDSDARKVWRLDEWVRFLAEFWSADFKVIESNALLLSKLFSFSHHAQAVDGKIVGYLMIKDEVSTDVKQVLRETLKDIHIRMDGESGFIQVEEVLEPFEVEKLLIDLCISANQLVSFCLTLHSNSKDLWKIKEEFYKPNIGKMICDTAEEILKELNQRMHFQDLYRKVTNHFSKMDISERYFSAKLHYDFRFQCIGKTGYWVLAAWNYERGTIFDCLCKVIGGEQEPLHIKDITRFVQEMTPAAPNSIKSYLQIRSDVFIKLPGNRYDLRERYPNRSKIDDEF